MSNLPRINVVAEGATDYFVLNALIARFLDGGDFLSSQIQPPTAAFNNDLGELGGGWKGVLKWCEQMGNDSIVFENSVLLNCDCLIIHIDADIASEEDLKELNLSADCPPARDTCDNIRKHLISLLGEPLPKQIVFCIPAQCTEAWVFASLHPLEAAKIINLECRVEVETLLIGLSSRLVRGKGGRTRKNSQRYADTALTIASRWPNATTRCPEAQRFETECKSVLQLI